MKRSSVHVVIKAALVLFTVNFGLPATSWAQIATPTAMTKAAVFVQDGVSDSSN
jgi:hypothetical protein